MAAPWPSADAGSSSKTIAATLGISHRTVDHHRARIMEKTRSRSVAELARLAAWAGIVIYVNTMSGQLVIESEVDGVEVTVLKNDTPTKDVRIEQSSKSTLLFAGEYQVVIKGDSDELIIDNDRITTF